MAVTLQWGSYTFPLTPKISVRREPTTDYPVPGCFRKTWDLEGELYANTPAACLAARQSIDAIVRGNIIPSLKLMDSATVLDCLLAENAVEPLTISGYDVPPADGTEYATHVPFRISVSGLFISTLVDTTTGTLPSNQVWGEYAIVETTEPNGNVRTSVDGFFRGNGTAIDEAVDVLIESLNTGDRRLMAKRITRHAGVVTTGTIERVNRVEFALEFSGSEAGSNDVYDFQESIDYQMQTRVTLLKPVLGNNPPIMQLGTITPAIITQSGQAFGRTDYPNAPSPLYSSHVEPAYVGKTSPVRGPDGTLTGFGRRWRYSMVVPMLPPVDAPNPNVQPG